MKKELLKISLLIVCIISLANTCNDNNSTEYATTEWDKQVSEFLGKNAINFINTADSVKIYTLAPTSNDTLRQKYMKYIAVNQSDTLTNEQVFFLHKILKSEKSYTFDNLVKDCTLFPNYSIAFFGKNNQLQLDTLSILLDFNCDVWHFCYKNQTKFEDFDNIRDSLLMWINDIVPNRNEVAEKTKNMETVYDYLQKQLSTSIAEQLINTDTISAFLLNPEEETNDTTNLFNGFLIIDKVSQLKEKEQKSMTDIIKNKKIQIDSTLVNNCTFLPDIGFRFYNENKSHTDILIAFYCNDWLFINNETRIIMDCEPIRKDLLDLAKNSFPNDKYLNNLPVESE